MHLETNTLLGIPYVIGMNAAKDSCMHTYVFAIQDVGGRCMHLRMYICVGEVLEIWSRNQNEKENFSSCMKFVDI